MTQRPLQSAAELLRLIHNLVRLGTVAEVDHARARVRVATGEITTAWLRWIDSRAGTTRTWCPPTVDEQVVVFSPGGDMAAAVVLTGLYRDAHPAPSDSGDHFHAEMPDGAVIDYDHVAGHLKAIIPGDITINATGEIRITAQGDMHLKAANIFENL
ncbi:MAG: phage baseplate assembly protein V [Pseudomonadota bacterium]